DQWDRRIQWDRSPSVSPPPVSDTVDPLRYTNEALRSGSWVRSIIWDPEDADNDVYQRPFDRLVLDLNDSHLLFEPIIESAQERAAKRRALRNAQDQLQMAVADEAEHRKQAQKIDKFNLSNDFFYAALQEGKVQRVRQTFGQLDVQHAVPAQKLQPPLYKTRLPKSELRSWHRPSTAFPIHETLVFSKLKPSKRKHKRKQGGEAFKSTKDITLKDTAPYLLLEYSEEHPPIVSNAGMGSLLLNYYRRKDLQDQSAPTADIGELFILDTADASPFHNFGNVEPGQTIPTLSNNLIRAPLFRHKPKPSDFLLIKSTYKGASKYFIREIPYLFTVGQTYPLMEVPGPHSRKVTNTIKNRLQVIAFRLIRQNPYHRLHMSKVSRYFPEYPETHIRLRLKEFMEFQRKGNNSGFWKLKPTLTLPNEEEIRKILTPEMMCLYESMLVGECHLRDSGYTRNLDGPDEEGNEDGDTKYAVEEQLAPWAITRNFINATQGKAMLKLYGPGDPTGRGEGFSFIRVSMKDIFLRAGETAEEKLAEIEARPKSAHRYNVAEQQQIYREEITRIWNAQFQALSNPQPPLSDGTALESSTQASHPSRASSPTPSMDRSSIADPDDDIGIASSSVRAVGRVSPNQRKGLVIRRYIRSPMTGELTWQTEVLRSVPLINAYLKQRAIIEAEITGVPNEPPLANLDAQQRPVALKRRTAAQLTALRQRREKRLAREKAREAMHMSTISLPQQCKPKKKTIRQCGNCGQLGHMKTNRKCPKF
ncbi:hypothetical protein BJ085DRAFT_328, partial [Dimargaris cristalligena]